jgi:two-component system C4-dicarboxylate transport response regulator DctD
MRSCVVYVDDEPLLCKAFSAILRQAQIPVGTFTQAGDALHFIRGNDVGVVVCDYRMPGLTGLELLERLDKDVPFYLVTGDLEIEQLASGRARVSGVLTKPFAPNLLLEIARRHLERPRG